ncbi:MAG: hypothetical protein ACWA44_00800 [Thiotrichales bacterium]
MASSLGRSATWLVAVGILDKLEEENLEPTVIRSHFGHTKR